MASSNGTPFWSDTVNASLPCSHMVFNATYRALNISCVDYNGGEGGETSQVSSMMWAVCFGIVACVTVSAMLLAFVVGLREQVRLRRTPTAREQRRLERKRKEFIQQHLVARQWANRADNDLEIQNGDNDDQSTASTESSSHASCTKNPASSSARSDDEGDEEDKTCVCAICLSSFQEGQLVCESNNTACTHIFHRDCIHLWLKKHEECPVCRAVYLIDV